MVMLTLAPSARSNATGSSKDQPAPQTTPLTPAQVSNGGKVSATVTFWLHLTRLLQPSIASQVRVAMKVFPQNSFVSATVLTSRMVIASPSHESLAIGGSKFHAFPSSMVLSGAQLSM